MRLLLLVCLFVFTSSCLAGQLQVQADQHRVELGKPIWLTLRSDQTAVSLDTLDFSAWRQVVAMPRAFYVNRNRDNTAQTLRLRVYPYHPGKLTLPGLHFRQQTTAALQFTILPAHDPVTQVPMDFACQVSNLKPWQQQQVVVACHLQLHDAYALLTQAAETPLGFSVSTMQQDKQTSGQGMQARTRYQLGWVVFAARAGKQTLRLPPIEYIHDGVVTRRFYPQPLNLQVRALPAWLPGTIPVGHIASQRMQLADAWLSTSVLSQLNLRVQLSGVAPSLVPDYPARLHSNHQFMFYRAQQQHDTRVSRSGMHYTLHASIPLVAHHIGFYQLPILRIQYFDPVRGTLETKVLKGGSVVVVNGGIKIVFVVLFACLLGWLAYRVWRFSTAYWYRFHCYQQALAILNASPTHECIRDGMCVMAKAEGWHTNLSFLQWQAFMCDKSALATLLPVVQLNAAVYGKGEINLENYVDRLRQICRQRRLAFY